MSQEFSVAATGPLPAHPGAATAAAQATMMEVPVATPPVMAPPTTATKSNKSSGMVNTVTVVDRIGRGRRIGWSF